MTSDEKLDALRINYCKDMLGYSGTMPLEVENQSEDAK